MTQRGQRRCRERPSPSPAAAGQHRAIDWTFGVAGVTTAAGLAVLGAGLALAAALLALAWPVSGARADRPTIGRVLPFHLDEVRPGAPAVQLTVHPGLPTVLNFFAAWCDPCHEELPVLSDLQRREGGRLRVIGVDVQDNRALAIELLAASGATFPAGYDPNRVVSDAWGVNGLPVTAFITAEGTVVSVHRGQLRKRSVEGLVNQLLVTGAARPHRQS